MDKLAVMMRLQAEFMTVLGIGNDALHFLSSQRFLEASVGMSAEAHEVIAETDLWTKPWKGKPLADREVEAKIEIVDVFFYMMESALLANMTADDLFYIYLIKLQRNCDRIMARESEMHVVEAIEQIKARIEQLKSEFGDAPGVAARVYDKLNIKQSSGSVTVHQVTQDALQDETL